MSTSEYTDNYYFDGSNWQDLTRLVTAARMKFLISANEENDKYETPAAKCAYLASFFRGPALDWVGQAYDANNAIFNNYAVFIENARQTFGISDEGLSAQRRGQLEGLQWRTDLPVFFAEFDRLTQLLGLQQDSTRIALLRAKLPYHVQKLLAEQALNFSHYPTMRERLLVMWSLDPSKTTNVVTSSVQGGTRKRPKCGRCGKKGHAASDCRAKN